MCLYSKLAENKKYRANKRNGGVIPAMPDKRAKWVAIGCGDCMECRKQRANGWRMRLQEEIRTATNGKFITLTFSNESIKKIYDELRTGKPARWHVIKSGKRKGARIRIPAEEPYMGSGYELDNEIATFAIRRFMERWRKKHGVSVRHWLVTELGQNGTENIHLHGIIWTDWNNEETYREVLDRWQYGHVKVGEKIKGRWCSYVSNRTVNYIVKYIIKQDEKHKGYKAKVLNSDGIGGKYITRYDSKRNAFAGERTDETYRQENGSKIALCNYWRNKIYNEQQREALWMHKLDREERYVCGERVSIKEGLEEYWKLVEYYREKNKQLGYGTGKTTQDRAEYEEKRRRMMMAKRMGE